MFKQLQHINKYRKTLNGHIPINLSVGSTNNPTLILEARQLHARCYLKWRYITSNDIDQDGTIKAEIDPHVVQSQYFIVQDVNLPGSPVVTTARQIRLSLEGQTPQHLPTLTNVPIDAHLHKILNNYPASECIEISALVKDSGVDSVAPLLLYREMWHHSLLHGHRLWIMGVDNEVYKRLHAVFGSSFISIGQSSFYMGSIVEPVALDVERAMDNMVMTLTKNGLSLAPWRALLARFFLTGVPPSAWRLQHVLALKQANLWGLFNEDQK